MNEYNTNAIYAEKEEERGIQRYITGVFTRMGIAVLITALVSFLGFYSIVSEGFMYSLMMSETVGGIVFIVPAIIQMIICVVLSAKLMSLQTRTAELLLYAYATLTGFTFSVFGLLYETGTFFTAFAFAAVMFLCCAVIGHTTSVDLTKFGGIMIAGLIAMVIASIAAIFIPFLRDTLIISYIGVILFLFLTAWDMQKIKGYYYGTQGGYGTVGQNLAVYGAFQLYLDFINLFLYILRIVGSRKRD